MYNQPISRQATFVKNDTTMISIDDQTYQAIATQLRDELTGKEFFNGQLEYDTEEFYSTLTCTLILRNDPDTGRLASATPVWWEYHLHQRDGEVLTDFSWSELSRFLEA